jgi:phosphoserine phosphatase RsbU/P
MAVQPRFSSTMRIDLTAEAEENAANATPLNIQSDTGDAHPEWLPTPGGTEFRELFESVYDAAIITNTEGIMLCANSRAEEFFQFPAKQFQGMHITELISGSNESLIPTINSSLQHDRFILIQAYCCRADGSTFPSEVSVNMLQLSGNQYISFFIRDVTFRKEAEEKLRTGHTAIQNSGNGIAVTDANGVLQYFNPAMAKLIGLRDDVHEPSITHYLCNRSIGDSIRRTILAGRPWSGELQMHCASDVTLVMLASVAPNLDADGEVVGMVWSLLDISDQKRIQNELRQHNAQLADDLNLANEFQLAFIQREYPTFPSGVPLTDSAIELGHTYLPSGAVGGDFFEIFAVSRNRVGIFISDVMGHGVRSALIVATIRGLIEELGPFRDDPAAFLSHMNRDLSRIISHPGQTMFASAFYLVLDLSTGEMNWASAGHPPALLLQAQTKSVQNIGGENDARPEPALGLFPETEFHAHQDHIAKGDMLLLYTDGIAEAESPTEDRIFDVSGLAQTLERNAESTVTACLQQIVADAQDFSGSAHFDDDVCMIGMRLRTLLP